MLTMYFKENGDNHLETLNHLLILTSTTSRQTITDIDSLLFFISMVIINSTNDNMLVAKLTTSNSWHTFNPHPPDDRHLLVMSKQWSIIYMVMKHHKSEILFVCLGYISWRLLITLRWRKLSQDVVSLLCVLSSL